MRPGLRDRILAEWRGYREPAPTLARVHPVNSLIGKTMQGLGLGSRVQEAEVLLAWREVVGDFIAENSKPSRLKEGVLYVQVLQPAIHFELERNWKTQIVQKLRDRFGSRVVREVRFRVGG